MTAESTQPAPRSRRALLAGAIGGLGVWAASAIGRAAPAEAAAGDPIRMGRLNKASGTQTVLQTDSSGAALLVRRLAAAPAIRGEATSGRAVMGVAGADGSGVWGSSPGSQWRPWAHRRWVRRAWGSTRNGHGRLCPGIQRAGLGGICLFHLFRDFQPIDPSVRLPGIWGANPSTPDAPELGTARLFARDDGTGKMQLCVRFPTGAAQVLATEP